MIMESLRSEWIIPVVRDYVIDYESFVNLYNGRGEHFLKFVKL